MKPQRSATTSSIHLFQTRSQSIKLSTFNKKKEHLPVKFMENTLAPLKMRLYWIGVQSACFSKVTSYHISLEENVQINMDDVAGKVLIVDKYLITCPNNVLREK